MIKFRFHTPTWEIVVLRKWKWLIFSKFLQLSGVNISGVQSPISNKFSKNLFHSPSVCSHSSGSLFLFFNFKDKINDVRIHNQQIEIIISINKHRKEETPTFQQLSRYQKTCVRGQYYSEGKLCIYIIELKKLFFLKLKILDKNL